MEAIRRLGSVVCRIYFLDGKSRALDICKLFFVFFNNRIYTIWNSSLIYEHNRRLFLLAPLDTAGDIVQRISESLGLNANDGWALYQVD